MEELQEKLDSDEIGELTAQSHANGEETIDWKNLSDEQVELIMDQHDCKKSIDSGCSVCAKLAEYGKIPEDNPDDAKVVYAEQMNPKEQE
jgi:hypothetical protein